MYKFIGEKRENPELSDKNKKCLHVIYMTLDVFKQSCDKYRTFWPSGNYLKMNVSEEKID